MTPDELKKEEFFRLKRGGYLPKTVSRMNPILSNFALLGIEAEKVIKDFFYSIKIESRLIVSNLIRQSIVPKSFLDPYLLFIFKFETSYKEGDITEGLIGFQVRFKRFRGIIKILDVKEMYEADKGGEFLLQRVPFLVHSAEYNTTVSVLYNRLYHELEKILNSPIPDEWALAFKL